MTLTLDERRSRIAAERRTLTIPLEFRAAEDGSGDFSLTGHAAVFDRLSEPLNDGYGTFQERIKRGAFRKVLDDHQDVVCLWEHDPRWLLASTQSGTLELREDPRGLYASAKVPPTSYASDLRLLSQRGIAVKMSFSFQVDKDRWTEETDDAGNVVITRDVLSVRRLTDVSVVAIPAYKGTDVNVRSLGDADTDAIASRVVDYIRSVVDGAKATETPEIDTTSTRSEAAAKELDSENAVPADADTETRSAEDQADETTGAEWRSFAAGRLAQRIDAPGALRA